MRKRKGSRKGGVRITVTVANEVDAAINQIIKNTGWSYSAALAFLARAGVDGLYGGGKATDALRAVLTAAIDMHNTDQVAKVAVAAKRAELRQAQAAMKAQAVAPAELPDRPPNSGRVIVSGHKKRRGRPRKTAAEAHGSHAEASAEHSMGHQTPEAPESQP